MNSEEHFNEGVDGLLLAAPYSGLALLLLGHWLGMPDGLGPAAVVGLFVGIGAAFWCQR
jgi:hypothetical protein